MSKDEICGKKEGNKGKHLSHKDKLEKVVRNQPPLRSSQDEISQASI